MANKMLKTDAVDRLSGLPSPLLHHVLSYLDMHEVVQTSLLSRKWRNTWASSSNLIFNYWVWKKFTKSRRVQCSRVQGSTLQAFIKFVDNSLLFRDGSNIRSFHLCAPSECDAYQIYKWLIVLVRRNIQEIYVHGSVDIPKFIFDSPSLKKLHLVRTILPQCDSNKELVLFCPGLDTLVLEDCEDRYPNLRDMNICAPLLKYFVLKSTEDQCNIKISAPNLISFEYEGNMDRQFLLENFSSIITAKFRDVVHYMVHVNRVFRVLTGLQNLSTLELSNCAFEDSKYDDDFDPPNDLESWKDVFLKCTFKHLKVIKVQQLGGYDYDLMLLGILLKKAIVLEKVIIITKKAKSKEMKRRLIQFIDKLHSLPRASSSVTIVYVMESCEAVSSEVDSDVDPDF